MTSCRGAAILIIIRGPGGLLVNFVTALRHCPLCAGDLSAVFRGHDFFCINCVAAVCQDDEVTYVYRLLTEETIFLATPALLATERRAAYTPAGGAPEGPSGPFSASKLGA